jgi:hypothetical protein
MRTAPTPIREGNIMVRYFYAWTPLVILGTIVLLALPWLGLIALVVVSVVALPAFALALVAAPYIFIRAIGRRLEGHVASPEPAVVLSPAHHRATLRKGYVA